MGEFRADVKAKMDEMLLFIPGTKASKAFGYPAYKVNGKVFLFVGQNGVAVKLPGTRAQQLIGTQPAYQKFKVGVDTVWPAWMSIQRDDAADYEQDIEIFEESVQFVAEG